AHEFSEHPNQFMHAENQFQRSYANTYGTDSFTGMSPSQKWNQFLDNNRDFARRYSQNPNIIRDPNVMAQEPGLREFLNNHPDVRSMIYARNGWRSDYPNTYANSNNGYGNAYNNSYGNSYDDDDAQAL